MIPNWNPAAQNLEIQHAKLRRVGSALIIGSTNWTTSARANQELSALLELNNEGAQAFEGLIEA